MDVVDEATVVHFPEEILGDILRRLPVWSLLRFKCVSKFWKTLISKPYFKMKHLNHAKNDQNSQKFLICQKCPKDHKFSIYSCPLSSVQLVEDVEKLDWPSNSKPGYCAINCFCNGLAIITVCDNIVDETPILLLWNPTTRESIVLPDPEFGPEESSCLGLAYDSTSGDYKILIIHDVEYDRGYQLPNEILALKSGLWTETDKHPCGIHNVLSGMHSLAFAHKAFHCIGKSKTSYFLVSFSISNEVYGEIPLPEEICLMSDINIGVSVLEGMLCAYSTYESHQGEGTFKLWVMKDYRVKESWNALFTIVDPEIYIAVPKYRFSDGELLFWCIHYECRTNVFRTSRESSVLWPQGAGQNGLAYTESLISPEHKMQIAYRGRKQKPLYQMDVVDEATAAHFQEEILVDILSRLPVQSLLRFKCVAKFWKTLISEPYFKMKHLNHAKNDQNSQKFLICQKCPKDRKFSVYSCPLSSVQLVEDVEKLDCPSNPKPGYCTINCFCDGLAVITVCDNIVHERSILLLWNPSTRESLVLTDPRFRWEEFTSLGLAYDSTSGDYKILIVHDVKYCDKLVDYQLPSEILALKSGLWRETRTHPSGVKSVLSGMHYLAFAHMAFHWIGKRKRKYFVVSFSISNEVYGEIPLPKEICLMRDINIGVSVLDGMLCAYSTYESHQGDGTFKLWVMKDYRVKESWNALFTIVDPEIYIAVPKYRFSDGELLFWCIHYQCGTNVFRTSREPSVLWPRGGSQNGFAFTESLISPKLIT